MSSVTLSLSAKGTAGREGADESFSTIKEGSGNAASTASVTMDLHSSTTSTQWNAMRRGFYVFDPSGSTLPTGYIITAAVLTVTPGAIPTDTFTQSLVITAATLASATTVSNSDYQGTNTPRTEYTNRIAIPDMTNGVGQLFTFNAAGLAYLTTQFGSAAKIVLGIRWSCDMDQVAPTWSSNVDEFINVTTASLAVTYRIGAGHAVATLTGTLGSAADTVACSLFTVELFT
jgi:hypothetical protein